MSKIPNSKSPITASNITKAANFLGTADGSSNKTNVKSAIAFLNKALKTKIDAQGPKGALAPLVPMIHKAVTQGEKALAGKALGKLEAATKHHPFRNLTAPTSVAADAKELRNLGRVEMQIKRRDGQNLLWTAPAPMMMRAMPKAMMATGTVVTENKSGGKNLRFSDGRDIVGAKYVTDSLEHILPKSDPRRAKLEAAGFDLTEKREFMVLQGEGDTHPTVILEGAGRSGLPGGDKNGVTILCTEIQFVPFKDQGGGGGPIFMKKPVVYLYPTQVQDVTVELHVDGQIIAQYPKLTGNAWHVKAGPTGEIFDAKTEKRFPYLFWEARRRTSIAIDPTQAFCIKGADAERFLEDVAAKFALNDRERTDFVTYWLPALERNTHSLVQILSDAEYSRYADMTVTPKPDTMNRLFMVFQKIGAPLKVGTPVLAQRDRRGFAVVEWGGANLDEIA